MRARATARAAVGLAALTLVAGCLPTASKDDPSDSSTSQALGRSQLSEEQLRAALPTDEQTPDGFTIDTRQEDLSDPESTTYPAKCDAVRLSGRAADDLAEHETAKVEKNYVGNKLGVLEVTIRSYDEPVPPDLYDEAGEALGGCSTFQIIDEEGSTDWKLSPVAMPAFGDRSYSIRVENTTKGDIFEGGVVQVASAVLGNNRVHVVHSAGRHSKYDPDVVEELARTTVANLEAL